MERMAPPSTGIMAPVMRSPDDPHARRHGSSEHSAPYPVNDALRQGWTGPLGPRSRRSNCMMGRRRAAVLRTQIGLIMDRVQTCWQAWTPDQNNLIDQVS